MDSQNCSFTHDYPNPHIPKVFLFGIKINNIQLLIFLPNKNTIVKL